MAIDSASNEIRPTVLITGASSGIGLSIATSLHDNGFRVFGTTRYPSKNILPFEVLELEVTSQESINRCFTQLYSRIDVLDILITNAGDMLLGSVEETPILQAKQQFDINFWGAVMVTKAALPRMRRQREGKIIAMSSLVGLFGAPYSTYYSASKHAMEGFFKSLRFELKPFNVHVSVVQPGFFNTNITNASKYVPPEIADYMEVQEKMSRYLEDAIANGPGPKLVADTVFKIIKDKSPRYAYPVGSGSKFLPFLQFFSYSLFEKGFIKNAKL